MANTREKLAEIGRYRDQLDEAEAMHFRHIQDEMPGADADLDGAEHARIRGDIESLHLTVTQRAVAPAPVASTAPEAEFDPSGEEE